jgi:hypothetical protein
MERDTALVFESLAEALRAKELIDAAGKPKYWLTFIDRARARTLPREVASGAAKPADRD